MIILPDRNIPRSRVLMPIKRSEWCVPSHAQQKTVFGHEDRTFFHLTARLHDGFIKWRGVFEDREDADAFLYALINGTLGREKEIWRLPTTEWHPGLGENLVYDFATQTILTTTGSNQTYNKPSDWGDTNSKIECLGGGGSGAAANTSSTKATGGGGGAYSSISNFSFSGSSVTYRVGSGQSRVSATANGVAGTVSYFNATSDPGNGTDNTKCSAAGGGGGIFGSSSSTRNGGAGGASGSSWGQTKYSGGAGGQAGGTNSASTGGGGAAGPNGAGGNGVTTTSGSYTAGGSANNGTTAGGSGGTSGSDGGSGTEFSASYGCGSGGGAAYYFISGSGVTGGNGGNYGAGGGASGQISGASSQSGAGIQGLVIVTYTPSLISLSNSNLPMMGL